MLFTEVSAAEKRAGFRKALASGKLLRFPGTFTPIVSLIIQEQGWDGVYISGAVLANELGMPDIGMTTLTEVATRGRQIAQVTDLPAIIDIDTGFGEAMSVARTIRELEDAGLAGCHLEDQVNPKRCGHLDGKEVVSTAEMTRKIRAAADSRRDDNFVLIARSDARAMEGLDKAIDRMKAYVDAGADMLFPEAMKNEAEFEAVRRAIDVPILANMTEFGKSNLLSVEQLENLGFNLVIYPVTSMRLALKAVEDGLAKIKEDGIQTAVLENMQTRSRLYEVLSYERYNTYDQSIFNFAVDDWAAGKPKDAE